MAVAWDQVREITTKLKQTTERAKILLGTAVFMWSLAVWFSATCFHARTKDNAQVSGISAAVRRKVCFR